MGRQDRGRFIQDQEAWVLQQTPDNLDTLAFPHGQVVNMPIRVQGQPVVMGSGLEALTQLVEILWRQCQRHIFQRSHRFKE